jgi:type IV pilus assembly protein PilM
MSTSQKTGRRPLLACEIAADRVTAARSDAHDRVSLYTAHSLSRGSVVPGLSSGNVVDALALRLAIGEALAAVRARSRDVIAVLPDAAVRVVLLDFDVLPDREADAQAIVRFRLKKSLPFNVDHAALSYDAHRSNGVVKVVAAVAPQSVVEEYEAAFRDAGYTPGVVLPSMLAALGAVDASQPALVVKVDATTVGVAIVDQEEVRLLRTLENPNGTAVTGAQIAGDVYPSVVFFEDTFGARIERVLLAGLPNMAEIAGALESQIGVRVQSLVTSRHLDTTSGDAAAPSLLAGVVGALVA